MNQALSTWTDVEYSPKTFYNALDKKEVDEKSTRVTKSSLKDQNSSWFFQKSNQMLLEISEVWSSFTKTFPKVLYYWYTKLLWWDFRKCYISSRSRVSIIHHGGYVVGQPTISHHSTLCDDQLYYLQKWFTITTAINHFESIGIVIGCNDCVWEEQEGVLPCSAMLLLFLISLTIL